MKLAAGSGASTLFLPGTVSAETGPDRLKSTDTDSNNEWVEIQSDPEVKHNPEIQNKSTISVQQDREARTVGDTISVFGIEIGIEITFGNNCNADLEITMLSQSYNVGYEDCEYTCEGGKLDAAAAYFDFESCYDPLTGNTVSMEGEACIWNPLDGWKCTTNEVEYADSGTKQTMRLL